MTVDEYFRVWLAHVKPNVEARTQERYSDLLLKNLKPVLGQVMLTQLKSVQISTAYAKLIECGRRDGKGGLSPRTVHHAHRAPFSALDQAERWKMVQRNPAQPCSKRKIDQRSRRKP
jgi:hypothetical protein